MKFRPRRFNIYLLTILAMLAGGCQALHLGRQEYTSLRVFVETSNGGSSGGSYVLVTRSKIPFYVNPEPFLTEEDLARATLVENADGTYSIRLQFNDHGALVLDMTSSSNRGRNLIIFAQWPPRGWSEPRTQKQADAQRAIEADPTKPRSKGWLSATLIREGLNQGSFTFTPDASREEAERIVRGLNNMVHQINKE